MANVPNSRDNRIPRVILERRRSVRLVEHLPFKIGHRGYEIEAVTVNIGLHGAMCLVDKDVPVMTQLNICFSLPREAGTKRSSTGQGRKLRLKGVVVRKERSELDGRYALAVFFSEIKEADQKFLQKYIEHHLDKL